MAKAWDDKVAQEVATNVMGGEEDVNDEVLRAVAEKMLADGYELPDISVVDQTDGTQKNEYAALEAAALALPEDRRMKLVEKLLTAREVPSTVVAPNALAKVIKNLGL